VKRVVATASLLALCAAAAACQVLFGIEEKHLAEGAVDASVDSASDAGIDAPSDSNVADSDGPASWVRRPPPRPQGDAAPSLSGKAVTFAVRGMYLGSIDPETDEPSIEAWKRMGYDLDGKCTTQEESSSGNTGVCTKRSTAGTVSQLDGEECRDNAGGHILSDAFNMLSIPYEKLTLAQSNSGEAFTLVLTIEDLDEGPDDAYAPGKLYVGAPRKAGETPPLWDGMDRLRIDERSVIDGGLESPRVVFAKGYVKDDVWVSNDFGTSPELLPLPLFGAFSYVEARTATISLRLNETHTRVLGSVLSAAATIPSIETAVWPGLLMLAQCSEGFAKTMLTQYVRPNADLADHPPEFVAPSEQCDLMSIGLQPEWKPVQPPDTVIPAGPAPVVCDAGVTD